MSITARRDIQFIDQNTQFHFEYFRLAAAANITLTFRVQILTNSDSSSVFDKLSVKTSLEKTTEAHINALTVGSMHSYIFRSSVLKDLLGRLYSFSSSMFTKIFSFQNAKINFQISQTIAFDRYNTPLDSVMMSQNPSSEQDEPKGTKKLALRTKR